VTQDKTKIDDGEDACMDKELMDFFIGKNFEG